MISVLRKTIPILEGKGEGNGGSPASSHPKADAVRKEDKKRAESKEKESAKHAAMKSAVKNETDHWPDTKEKVA